MLGQESIVGYFLYAVMWILIAIACLVVLRTAVLASLLLLMPLARVLRRVPGLRRLVPPA
jgi:hypothetical protein